MVESMIIFFWLEILSYMSDMAATGISEAFQLLMPSRNYSIILPLQPVDTNKPIRFIGTDLWQYTPLAKIFTVSIGTQVLNNTNRTIPDILDFDRP